MSVIPEYLVIPEEIQGLTSVVAAWISEEGVLLSANKGFLDLVNVSPVGSATAHSGAGHVEPMFIQPNFHDLWLACHKNPEAAYHGLISIGSIDKDVKTLTGSVRLSQGCLYLIAEHDVSELDNLHTTLLNLNEALTETQRELARTNRSLEQRVQERTAELRSALEKSEAAEQAFRQSLQDNNDIMDSMLDGILTIDETGRILTCNKGTERLFGYLKEELLGQNIKMLMPHNFATQHDGYLSNYLLTGQKKIIGTGREVLGKRKDGSEFPMFLSVVEMHVEAGSKRRFIGSCADLTEKKRQEQLITRSQKMDALGQLTGGIAHDFNNLLGIILGYSEAILKISDTGSKTRRYANEVFRAAERGAKLTNKLLGFSRAKIESADVFDINNFLVEERDMISKLVTARILVKLKLQSQLWPIWVDKSSFEDAIINLSINAMHAIEGSGYITIETSNKHIVENEASMRGLQPGDYVLMSFSDTGCGIDADTLERIFDPFFSTKGEDGTGLGLSQLYGFIKRSGGFVDVHSKPGEGTAFEMFFPRHEASVTTLVTRVADSTVRFSREYLVLVVDDEPELARINKEMLELAGLRAIYVDSSEAALKILEAEPVDLVLSDIVMPDMDGYALAEYVQEHYPRVKVQLMSGFAGERVYEKQGDDNLNTILSKPCTSQELLERLQYLLEKI